MKGVPPGTTAAWLSGDYTGDRRPMTRVVVQRPKVLLTRYDLEADQILHESVVSKRGKFASIMFGQLHTPIELPNLANMKWSRDVDQPVATATLEFFNSQPYPLGVLPPDGDVLDQPGWFTYNRGVEDMSSTWGYAENGWRGLLVPDVVLRTYEGYGFDPTLAPEADPHMSPSGVWWVDEVQYTANGMIRVQVTDLAGPALQQQIAFPPVVPWAEYPLSWEHYRQVANPTAYAEATDWVRPDYDTDSNQPYVGTDITDGGRPYVSASGAVQGHHGSDAFDGSTYSYWLSVGNEAWWSSAYEYVQGTLDNVDVSAVRVRVHGGPYRGYVSIKSGGEWKGGKTIPYGARVVDTDADIKYLKAFTVEKNGTIVVKLPKTFNNVDKVRITFTDLWNSGIGTNYPYRAGVRDVQVRAAVLEEVDGGTHTEGNYEDFTDIVKWFCAWGGFFWPMASSGQAFQKWSDGTTHTIAPSLKDPVFPSTPGGRVWGDFMDTGTYGEATLGVDLWDKKPLLDCITYIRDIVNFIFAVDEGGGVLWRQPNIWKVGNFIWSPLGTAPVYSAGETDIVTLSDEQTVTELTTKLSNRNTRESVFVGNVAGNFGAVAHGFVPSGTRKSGLRRVGGWTDQRFETAAECQKMADLITLRQMMSFRENSITIAANPAIQIDDQVRISERVTNDSFLHYVKGITSQWDLRTGKWTYALTTNWLGEEPGERWAFNPDQLSAEAQRYLYTLGMVTSVVGESEYETEVLEPGDSEVGRIQIPRDLTPFHVKKVTSDRQVRVRLYETVAARTSDLGRAYTAPNPSVSGLILDVRTEKESDPPLEFKFDPDRAGTCADQGVPITVQNRSGARRAVKVKIKWRVP